MSNLEFWRPIRRTFAASRAATEEERQQLNTDALTSQYYTSQPYLVRELFTMSDGTPHPRQPHINHTFRTKREAQAWIDDRQA